jgi:hypothetical protein
VIGDTARRHGYRAIWNNQRITFIQGAIDMKIQGNPARLIAVAALAFVAGHLAGSLGDTSPAVAQEPAQPAQEIDARMQAMVEAGTPGLHHRRLDRLAGQWVGEFRMRMEPDAEPMVSGGTVRREWIMDGRYLQETVEARSEQGAFQGLGFIGYNNFDGQYEMVWMDSMSTAIFVESGTYHPDTHVMHTRGNHRDPVTGRLMNSWTKVDMSDPDRHVFTSYATDPEGRTFTAMEGVLERAE